MIIVCLVLVLAAFAVIGTALALAELTLVYVGLGLGGLSAVLLTVEAIRIRQILFGKVRPEPLAGQLDADIQGGMAGGTRTDGLGKASVRTAPALTAVGAGIPPADVENSREPAYTAEPGPAPVSEPVRAAVHQQPDPKPDLEPDPEPPVEETKAVEEIEAVRGVGGDEETAVSSVPFEDAGEETQETVHDSASVEGDEETEEVEETKEAEGDEAEVAPVPSGASPDVEETVDRLPVSLPAEEDRPGAEDEDGEEVSEDEPEGESEDDEKTVAALAPPEDDGEPDTVPPPALDTADIESEFKDDGEALESAPEDDVSQGDREEPESPLEDRPESTPEEDGGDVSESAPEYTPEGEESEFESAPVAVAFSEPAEWNPPAYVLNQHADDADRGVSAASIAALAAQWTSPSKKADAETVDEEGPEASTDESSADLADEEETTSLSSTPEPEESDSGEADEADAETTVRSAPSGSSPDGEETAVSLPAPAEPEAPDDEETDRIPPPDEDPDRTVVMKRPDL